VGDTPAGLEITVPSKRNWLLTIFLGFWLCGWAIGEVVVPTQFFSEGMPPEALLFTIVWLCLWTIGGAFALYAFLWSLVGRERIIAGPNFISIKREILSWGRSREYELTHVRNLRVAPAHYNPFDLRSGLQFWGIGGGTVSFDHGSATVRFGAGLEESEARSIVGQIQSRVHIPESAA
jgi:hypothetical protein